MDMKKYFVTAISTDSGKTLVSALLTELLHADYWKPIQSGNAQSDKETVRKLISNPDSFIHDEVYSFEAPVSPHLAAQLENVEISIESIVVPKSSNNSMIIEGAGGVLVPINSKQTILDLILKLDIEVIVVSNHYLGSINHTLLTINALKQANVKIKGIVFNGKSNYASELIIEQMTGVPVLFTLNELNEVDSITIAKEAERLNTLTHGIL
jgi:dethiobiotin synthetase